MADATHGLGGLKYETTKRTRAPEWNVFGALALIVVVFGRDLFGHHLGFHDREAGRLLSGDGQGRDHRGGRGAGPVAAAAAGQGAAPWQGSFWKPGV